MIPRLCLVAWALLIGSVSYVSASPKGHNYYAITGTHSGIVTSQNGTPAPRPARQNIVNMQNNIPMFSLFMQAMIAMQSTNESDPLSWFQVAGIHGRPYTSWDGVGQGSNCYTTGYCTHNSVLFLTWHRPYLALLEQVLASHCQNIAAGYPEDLRATYQEAADSFRFPYWDWASDNQMPEIVTQLTVTIVTPSGVQIVDNPLYTYKFQNFPLDPTYFPTTGASDGYLANYTQTERGVQNSGGPGDTAFADSALATQDFMKMTWNSLVKTTSYDGFCTTAVQGGNAIENVHNIVHSYVGWWGHMGYLSYAAFDPIFFLHHVNVDRLFALWDAINPNQSFTSLNDGFGTYTINPNTLETVSTPLKPFSSDDIGQWYTSTTSRSTSTFGYTYPEIDDWNQTPSQLQSNCTAAVNNMYNPGGTFGKRAMTKGRGLLPGQQTIDWSVEISVNKLDLQGERFMIHMFLEDIPQDHQQWPGVSFGTIPIFPPPFTGDGPYPEILMYSEVSLEKGLANAGCDAENIDSVKQYLTSHMKWAIQKYDGSLVSPENVPSLSITVGSQVVTMAGSITELPKFSKKTHYAEITHGNAGGYYGK